MRTHDVDSLMQQHLCRRLSVALAASGLAVCAATRCARASASRPSCHNSRPASPRAIGVFICESVRAAASRLPLKASRTAVARGAAAGLPAPQRARRGANAASEFHKILAHPGIVVSDPVGLLAHLQLARSYVLLGEKAEARSAYADFVALWKDADSDAEILKQAKAEYAKLR